MAKKPAKSAHAESPKDGEIAKLAKQMGALEQRIENLETVNAVRLKSRGLDKA